MTTEIPPRTERAPVPGLQDLLEDDIRALTHADLAALCRRHKLAAGGKRPALIDRLIGLRRGGDRTHVHGKTLCPFCRKADMRVESTAGGIRYCRCRGCGYRTQIPV